MIKRISPAIFSQTKQIPFPINGTPPKIRTRGERYKRTVKMGISIRFAMGDTVETYPNLKNVTGSVNKTMTTVVIIAIGISLNLLFLSVLFMISPLITHPITARNDRSKPKEKTEYGAKIHIKATDTKIRVIKSALIRIRKKA